MSNYPDVPAGCFDGSLALLIGDSLAGSLFGSFAHGFNDLGLKLLYMGQEGCDPLLLVPSERERLRQGPCAKLLVPFDLLLSKPSAIVSVVVTPRMSGRNSVALWSELISQFDRSRARILLLAPSPRLELPALDCVVLSDSYGMDRERCSRPRGEVKKDRRPIKDTLVKVADDGYGNVRTIDPIDIFCDPQVCRPIKGSQLFYDDEQHLLPSGADKVWRTFVGDFHWAAWKE